MTVLTVTVGGNPLDNRTYGTGRRLRLWTRDTGFVTLPTIPRDGIDIGGLPAQWERVTRPGRKPMLLFSELDLETVSFSVRLRYRDTTSVLVLQRKLKRLARTEEPIAAAFAGRDWGTWRMTGLAISEDPTWDGWGNPTLSMADIELTEAVDAAAVVGPIPWPAKVSGGGKGYAT